VLVGVGAVALTGWLPLDSLVALAVAANIVFSGVKIVRKAVAGLMDSAIPEEDLQVVRAAIAPHLVAGVTYHALRTRLAGVRRFVSFHVLVPGEWPVLAGHQLLERIEADIRKALPGTTVFTHLEAAEDPTALEDTQLDREGLTPSS
jgi:divalent metal cation (Fe/Co/Zn/Cd) transporter